MASSQKPNILLLSLAYQDFFDKTYGPLVNALLLVSNVKRAKTKTAALEVFLSTPLKARIITDEALCHLSPKNQEVFDLVKSYIVNGGLVIVGLHFPNFIHLDKFDGFFEAFGVPWKRGEYHRTICGINRSCTFPSGLRSGSMPDEYSMKADHVQGARKTEKMFVPIDDAKTESRVLSSKHVNQAQAAAAAATIGEGTLVYCGDVNGESGSNALMMSLCGFNY